MAKKREDILKKGVALPHLAISLVVSIVTAANDGYDKKLLAKANKIHEQAIVIDTHVDTPINMARRLVDIGQQNDVSDVDLPKMEAGGVDAAFFAVFTPNSQDERHPSKRALEVIDAIHMQVAKYPTRAKLAFSAADIRRIEKSGKRAILIGMENGGPVEGSLSLLRTYYRLGVRYVTLTHVGHNPICDSSTPDEPKWNGVSPFGREMIAEMNRLGVMIDVSHVSDKSFWDVLELSKTPVIASHSCVRTLCNSSRNLTDDMIRALAKNGGVVHINFYSGYLSEAYRIKRQNFQKEFDSKNVQLKEQSSKKPREYHQQLIAEWRKIEPEPVDVGTLIDHIDHVVQIAGIDHVGLGSDYDGASAYPKGLEDISGYPLITYHLLKRGYTKKSITKILGGNLLRVFDRVEKYTKNRR